MPRPGPRRAASPAEVAYSSIKTAWFVLLLAAASCAPPGELGPPEGTTRLETFDPEQVGGELEAPPTAPPGDARLGVVRYGPKGEFSGEAVFVQFDSPVVELAALDDRRVGDWLTISPPVEGEATWQDPHTLRYEFKEPPPRATRFDVRLAGPIEALDGARFEEALAWSFTTEPPRVSWSRPSRRTRSVTPDTPLLVGASQPVALDAVKRALTVTTRPLGDEEAAGAPTPFRLRRLTAKELETWGGARSERLCFAIEPQRAWPLNSAVHVELSEELVGELGSLPAGRAWSTHFSTYAPLEVTDVRCGEKEQICTPQPIEVDFNNPLPAGQRRVVSVTPRPDDFKVDFVEDGRGDAIAITLFGEFKPEVRYTIKVSAGTRDIYGQRLGRAEVREVVFAAPPTWMGLSNRAGVLAPGRARTIGLTARYVARARVRTAVLTDAQVLEIHASGQSIGVTPRSLPSIASLGLAAREAELTLKTRGPTSWSSTALDLEALSGVRSGVLLVEAEATQMVTETDDPDGIIKTTLPGVARGIYWLTDLGGFAEVSAIQSVARVARISDGAPVRGAEVSMLWGDGGDAPRWWGSAGRMRVGETDANGLIVLPDASRWPDARRLGALWVEGAEDRVLIPLGPSVGSATRPQEAFKALKRNERMVGALITERGIYRPGETVYAVGWSAVDTPWTASGLRDMPEGVPVVVTMQSGPDEVARVDTVTGPHGKVWAELPIPDGGALGWYRVKASFADGAATLERRFKVEDFRTPEFEVQAVAERARLIQGEANAVHVTGSYYFGGPVPMNHVSHRTTCQDVSWSPPGLKEQGWEVGFEPRWGTRASYSPHALAKPSQTHGTLTLPIHPPGGSLRPRRCATEVAVRDASFQEVGASASFMVHPARLYVAVKAPRDAKEGDEVAILAQAVTLDGERAAATERATVEVALTEYVPVYTTRGERRYIERWERKTEVFKTCQLALGAAGADARCALPRLKQGSYQIKARLEVDGNVTETKAVFWASPSSWTWRASGAPRDLEIHVQPEQIKPGDAVQVMVRSKWSDVEGALLVMRGGIREVHPLKLQGQQATLRFEATDAWAPNIFFRALVVVPAGEEQAPEVYRDDARVEVSTDHRRLKVGLKVQPQAGPGDVVPVEVTARDARGEPLGEGGRVALWAVDEAVLALTSYQVPDLLAEMMIQRGDETRGHDMYSQVLRPYVLELSDPSLAGRMGLGAKGYGSGGGGMAAGGAMKRSPPARQKFKVTPLFLADAPLNSEGRARATIELPENLTTFRVIAVASAPLEDGSALGRMGTAEAPIQVSAPLVVRAALPRVARPGDELELAAIVNNGLGPAGRLETSIVIHGAGGAARLLSEPVVTQQVAAGAQVRVPFRITTPRVGTPAIELRARLVPDDPSVEATEDAMRVELPVERERMRVEQVAMYGDLNADTPVAVPVKIPEAVAVDVGGVEVSTSSSLLGGLEDAVHELIHYPYGCVEQTSSRMVPLVALSELGATWPLEIGDTDAFVKAGVERLLSMQTDSGGFSYWPEGATAHPYGSAYATWVLHMAKRAGHDVPDRKLTAALDYLEEATRNPDRDWPDSALYRFDVRRAIAVHALAEAGRAPREAIEALTSRYERLPLFSRAFVLMALHRVAPEDARIDDLRSALTNNIAELPGTAHVSERLPYNLGEAFYSDGRSDAIVLMALLAVQPEHPLVPKLARGLLERRRGGAWRNTQENAYALVALARFGAVYEREEPAFTARAWVGDTKLLESPFKGRQLDTRAALMPQKELVAQLERGESVGSRLIPVTLQRQGQGRMYYRIGMRYAIEGPISEPRFSHMELSRALRGADGHELGRDAEVDAGEVVALVVNVRVKNRMRYVAVDIPLPAGLEAVLIGPTARALPFSRVIGRWVSHEELRRDRVLLFADDLSPGEHRHMVVVRATTPGRFAMPSAMAQNMYMPEVFARTPDATVTVRY